MVNLINHIWDFKIFRGMKKNKYSNPFIILSLIVITITGLISVGEFSAYTFIIYGIVIIYTGYIYGTKAAVHAAALSFILNEISQYNKILNDYNNGLIEKIIVEKIVIVVLFFLATLLFTKLLIKEREAKENYKQSMETCVITSKELAMANASINELYVSTIQALASSIEVKDPYTKGHSERVTKYAVSIAREMRIKAEDVRLIMYAAILHDIGKIGIDEAILKKPEHLTKDEFDQIKKHPEIGGSIIASIKFLQPIIPIILYHHEYFDGTGYPSGLKGAEIPIGARILTVVDSFDAMIYDRPYRKCLDWKEAMEQIRQGAGTQFDPEVVAAFMNILAKEKGEKSLGSKLRKYKKQEVDNCS